MTKEQNIKLIPKENNEKHNVLIAEDAELNQMMALSVLEKLGCQVTIATNGKEAIEQFKKKPFDIVFMDCKMPVVSGYEATLEIRYLEKEKHKNTPIIALTSQVFLGDREKCLEAGMDDYITKPVRAEEICEIINKWCAGQPVTSDDW